MKDKMLVLENGRVFYGQGFGGQATRIAEIVFNTSMVGYQEIFSDPSYCGQMVVMSYPLIGNYGLTDEDYESKNIYMSGFIVREYNDIPSNFRFTKTLGEVMTENRVAGISGVDTREIVRIIRNFGTMKAMITDSSRSVKDCLVALRETSLSKTQVDTVSSRKIWYSRTRNPHYTVVAVDCGMKLNILRKLNQFGCNVVVVPYNTSKTEIEKFKPDGLFLSNGPGNPEDLPEVINLVKEMKGTLPIAGVGLGHQIIALACGAKTKKMSVGHRGANHPVKNLQTGKIEITNQNHSYTIDTDSLKGTGLALTHTNLIDGAVEGLADESNMVLSLQYQPDSVAEDENIFSLFTAHMTKAGGTRDAQKNRY
ncbi:MAG: glutamine-hydrolyzing carbamoyl-phosphate synthase small subunit [Clostridia bacterium]